MNIQEACKVLGIEPGTSKEDAKKAFRRKAAEFHPDKNNNSKEAEEKFKEVNTAYQLIEKHGTTAQPFSVNSDLYDHSDHLADELRRRMNDFFPGANFDFGRPNQVRSQPIIVHVEVPFEMAVLGGKKDITYERGVKCGDCTDGKVSGKTMCQKCGGHGHRKYGSDDKELPCTTCGATGYISNKCEACQGSGNQRKIETLRVTIPPGAMSGLRLILKGKGNFHSGIYDNVIAVISVVPDHDMQLSNGDVISVIELSLLEALQGTKKKLRTVKGEKTLAFKPKTKHRDTVRVAGFGVPPHGAHVVVVNVSYPEDVSDIVELLETKTEPEPEEVSGVQS